MAARKKAPKEQKPTCVSAGAFAENEKQDYMAPSMKYVPPFFPPAPPVILPYWLRRRLF